MDRNCRSYETTKKKKKKKARLSEQTLLQPIALKFGCDSKQIRIFIPSSLETYKTHYFNRAREGVVTKSK